MRVCSFLLIVAISILFQNNAFAECDYHFSGRLLVEHNGKTWPLRSVKVRVKRENGTGAGRNYVRTDNAGNFSGVWQFDRDQNGSLPGGGDIKFAVQLQLQDDDKLKVGKGGWFNTPWDTFETAAGAGCTKFIWTKPFILDADSLSSNDLPYRAFIYTVHEELLRQLDAHGVGLKNRIEVIYPDKHVYNRSSSFFIQKSHIDRPDWDDVVTLIHETMHQWTVNWMRGAESPGCVADAHHKSPDNWKSARCSGFMEGFAQATAIAIYRDAFASKMYFRQENAPGARPESLENLRTKHYDGAIKKTEDAERSDEGWENFLKFVMHENEWEPFCNRKFQPCKYPPGLFNLPSCTPTDVTIYPLLSAIKAENPQHDGSRARFSWIIDILKRRANDFDEWDGQFYQALGDPATDPVDLQKQMCADARAAAERLLDPLKKHDLDMIKKKLPIPTPGQIPGKSEG